MSDTIELREDFADTPTGKANLWKQEMAAWEQDVKKFRAQGRRVTKRYLDERNSAGLGSNDSRLNLFWSNTSLIQDILFGQVPTVDVGRRYGDSNDDVARVSSEMMERMLNSDIQADTDTFTDAISQLLQDRLLPGLGVARVRYEAEFETMTVPPALDEMGNELAPGYEEEKKIHEACPVEYVFWEDCAWSPCRVWSECRWFGFRAYMTKDEANERFGELIAGQLEYGLRSSKNATKQALDADPWQRAQVWEIWSKELNKVIWWSDGCDVILDEKDDPLGLEGFFPTPKPMMANLTTKAMMPKADFIMVQDQYNAIDVLTTRIDVLTSALKLVGVYDKSADGVQRMLNEGAENDLIPVDNWAMFAEKGGIKGQVDWLPIAEVSAVLDRLVSQRQQQMMLLDQLIGMSDIVRGQTAEGPARSATEQGIKGRYSSARLQAQQDRLAAYGADLQRLKAEVIVKHFDDETIVMASNIQNTPDENMIGPALELLRNSFAMYRIKIESEAMAMSDYSQMQSERTTFLQGLSTFLTAAAPLVTQAPETTPFLLEMLKWSMSGFKGAQQIEGVLDQAIEAAKQPKKEGPGGQKPDPALQKEQVKAQAAAQKAQAKMQELQVKAQGEIAKINAETNARMQEIQAETQSSGVQEQQQAFWGVQEAEARAEIKRQEDARKARLQMVPRV